MIQAEKRQDWFKSFYGMARFALNNASSQMVNYVIFFLTYSSIILLTSPN